MDFATARRNMVESQVRANKVTDERILQRMTALPREQFVPKARRQLAYIDEDLDLGTGRCLMEPCTLARLLQAAAVEPDDVALVIGCTSGYSAALLAGLAATVFAVEADEAMAADVGSVLTELAIDNIVVETRPHAEGWPEQGPYDVILIDGAVPEVPKGLLEQLSDGGRLVCVVQQPGSVGRATLFGKRFGAVSHRVLFDATISPCPGFEQKTGFVF